MPANADSIPVKLLKGLSQAVFRRPKLFVYPQIALFVLSVYYTWTNLEFSMSRNDLVGSDKKYHQIYLQFKRDFNMRDDLVAVVESEHPEKNRQFVERLGARLEAETNLFSEVFYKGDLKMLGPKALLFLDQPTLIELQNTLQHFRPFIAQFARATNLNSLFSLVNHQFRTASRSTNQGTESLVQAIPALERVVTEAADSLQRTGTPPSPGVTALFGAAEQAQEEQYLTFAKGRIYLVNARTRKDEDNPRAVERLRELVDQTQAEVPGVNCGITGEPVLEYDEMVQSQKDTTVATIVSLVLCALLFIFSYHETGRPIKATVALVIGLGYTMAYTTLAVGHLNILTITFLPILIGLAIDFGVHLITRYEEELRHGRPRHLSLEKAMVNTGLGIFTGAFTTSGAFFAMGLTDFKGIQEMGIITGGGLLVCLLPMMTFLPALLLGGKQNVIDEAPHPADTTRARLEKLWLDRPRGVCAFVIIGTVLAIIPIRRVYFDYNLLHMQASGLPSVIFEHKLIESAGKSLLYAVVIATNQEHAIQLESQITNLTTVASVESMARYLVGDQTRKLQLIGEIKQIARGIKFLPVDVEPVVLPELSRTLWSLHGYLGLAIGVVEQENQAELAGQLRSLRKAIEELRYLMNKDDIRRTSEKLGAYQRALFEDLHETFRALRTQDNSAPLRQEDLPLPLRSRFIGDGGKHLLQVYPKGNVWERKDQRAFVKELRTVAPDATGTPIQLYEYTTLLKNSYIEAAWYSLAAIVVLVFAHFRRPGSVILSLIPVAIGSLWMGAIMGLLDVPFNPANIMTLPLVIGIGVTNGIHILNRFAEEENPSILAKSTGKAVIVSAFTTIAGFGSLILAEHRGIQSLGIVMSVGVAMCMLAAITFLPALLTLLMKRGWHMKRPSDDNAQSTLGREEPR